METTGLRLWKSKMQMKGKKIRFSMLLLAGTLLMICHSAYAFFTDYKIKTLSTQSGVSLEIEGDSGVSSIRQRGYVVKKNDVGWYRKGTDALVSADIKQGYVFQGWYHASVKVSEQTDYQLSVDAYTKLEARSGVENYSITYDLAGGTVSGNPAAYHVETETFTLQNPVRTGYTFVGWSGSNGIIPQINVSIPKGSTGNKSYTANWKMNTYTVTFVDGLGNTLSTQTVNYGADAVPPGNPGRLGYYFAGWSGSYTGVDSDRRITAAWTKRYYYLTTGSAFRAKVPANATSILFCNDQPPYGVTTYDVSLYQDNSVVAWFSGTVFKVSNQSFAGDVIYFNQDCTSMFEGLEALRTIDFGVASSVNTTSMSRMCYGCSALSSINVEKLDVSGVSLIDRAFAYCNSVPYLDVSNWNTANFTTLDATFLNCFALRTLDVSRWNIHNVTTLKHTFFRCESLERLDVSNWDTRNVGLIHNTFWQCYNLTSLDVSRWNTSNVRLFFGAFYNCANLSYLNLNSWSFANATGLDSMFRYCWKLQGSITLNGFNPSMISSYGWFFEGTGRDTANGLTVYPARTSGASSDFIDTLISTGNGTGAKVRRAATYSQVMEEDLASERDIEYEEEKDRH